MFSYFAFTPVTTYKYMLNIEDEGIRPDAKIEFECGVRYGK